MNNTLSCVNGLSNSRVPSRKLRQVCSKHKKLRTCHPQRIMFGADSVGATGTTALSKNARCVRCITPRVFGQAGVRQDRARASDRFSKRRACPSFEPPSRVQAARSRSTGPHRRDSLRPRARQVPLTIDPSRRRGWRAHPPTVSPCFRWCAHWPRRSGPGVPARADPRHRQQQGS